MTQPITTYREFWPYYLGEHKKPVTRALHYVGTALAIGLLIALFVTGDAWYLLVSIVSGYLFAWIGHFGVERNRPATFRYPFWSLASDFRMFFCAASGRLKPELKRAGVI